MNTIIPSIQQSQLIQFTSTKNIDRKRPATLSVDRLEKVSKVNPDEKPVKMLLTMLGNSLTGKKIDASAFKGVNYADWKRLYEIAEEASVGGMALNAAENLPEGVTIPKDIQMRMIKLKNESAQRHHAQEAIIGELSEMFAKEGIETIQMKGVGFSMNYPEPTDRFGGDIDIFTRKKGTVTTTRSNTGEFIDKFITSKGYELEDHHRKVTKHSEFDYKGVRIENHRYFLNKELMSYAEPIDEYLHKVINPHEQILPNGTKILVPSKEFNSVFISHHAFQHFVYVGLDLHHLTDWGMHLKENGLQIPKEVKGTPFEKFIYAFTNLSNKYLGTDIKVPEDKAFEAEIFQRMLNPEDFTPCPEDANVLETIVFKAKRFVESGLREKKYFGKAFWTGAPKRVITRLIEDPKTLIRKM